MTHLPFQNIEQAKAATIAGDGVVLYADADIAVILYTCEDGSIRDGSGPVWELDTFVSEAHPAVIAASVYPPGDIQLFEWNGVKYVYGTMEINDYSPIDQSDLTNPGAIAAKTPEMYEPIDSLIACWSNPASDEIKEILASLRRADEMEASPVAGDTLPSTEGDAPA